MCKILSNSLESPPLQERSWKKCSCSPLNSREFYWFIWVWLVYNDWTSRKQPCSAQVAHSRISFSGPRRECAEVEGQRQNEALLSQWGISTPVWTGRVECRKDCGKIITGSNLGSHVAERLPLRGRAPQNVLMATESTAVSSQKPPRSPFILQYPSSTLYWEHNTVLTVKKYIQEAFLSVWQSIYWRVNLELRGKKLLLKNKTCSKPYVKMSQ